METKNCKPMHIRTSDSVEPVCLNDFEELARQVLPKVFFAFFADGADEEVTLNENKAAFKR